MPARPEKRRAITWRKSHASQDSGECVEIAVGESYVLVRDSRDKNGAVLKFTFAQWLRLMSQIRKEEPGRGLVDLPD
jgi:Domain of unknown function (DUF397)